jgi:hypothetical protein
MPHLDRTAAFGARLGPTEAGQDPTDDRHSRPENPMLFDIACRAKLKVSREKMDFRAYIEQAEYDQEQDEKSIGPLFRTHRFVRQDT